MTPSDHPGSGVMGPAWEVGAGKAALALGNRAGYFTSLSPESRASKQWHQRLNISVWHQPRTGLRFFRARQKHSGAWQALPRRVPLSQEPPGPPPPASTAAFRERPCPTAFPSALTWSITSPRQPDRPVFLPELVTASLMKGWDHDSSLTIISLVPRIVLAPSRCSLRICE